MKNRFCVEIIHDVVVPFSSELDHDYEAHFFDTYESAEFFRKQCKRSGIAVSNVMDLLKLPF